jgi:hypothetical protein
MIPSTHTPHTCTIRRKMKQNFAWYRMSKKWAQILNLKEWWSLWQWQKIREEKLSWLGVHMKNNDLVWGHWELKMIGIYASHLADYSIISQPLLNWLVTVKQVVQMFPFFVKTLTKKAFINCKVSEFQVKSLSVSLGLKFHKTLFLEDKSHFTLLMKSFLYA